MKKIARAAALLCLLFISMLCTPASAEDDKNKVASASLFGAQISPDGKYVAGIIPWNLDPEQYQDYLQRRMAAGSSLVLYDTDTLKPRTIRAASTLFYAGNWVYLRQAYALTWVTNDLLAIQYPGRAELVNLKGEVIMQLGQSLIGKFDSGDPENPILVVSRGGYYRTFYYADLKTKDLKEIALPRLDKVFSWAFDKKGKLRAVSSEDTAVWSDKTVIENWYLDPVKDEWVQIAEFKITDRRWTPVGVESDGKTLVVRNNIGRDTTAIFRYDVEKRAIGEMLAGHPTEDILDTEGVGENTFKSVLTSGMKPQKFWFDRDWKSVQATVDASIPNHVNNISGDPKKRVLIYSYNDVSTGEWSLLDMEAKTLRRFAKLNPNFDMSSMRPMEITSYPAKDGLTIPAYLTRPAKTSGPAPMVVVIHGGPVARDYWQWNPEVQILALRGYVVLQPQFRGSSGFGIKFQEAGYGQWGLAMQDDITAGVEAMIQRGIADPKRICIYGASYGGYAALWGLAKTPDLYRCGVSVAGVSDLEFMFSDSSDSNRNKVARELLRTHVGDVSRSKEQFDQVSPLKHADRIQAPVLLVHGNRDERVPISHSKKMIEALKENKKYYEWLELPGEEHGFTKKSKIKFMEKLLAFLEKYIPPDSPPESAKSTTATITSVLEGETSAPDGKHLQPML